MGKNYRWAWILGAVLVLAAGIGVPAAFAFASGFDPSRVAAWFTGVLAFATLLAATAIFAAFGQVRETKKALRDNRAWNRMSAAVTFMPSPDLLYRWEIELEATFVKLISRNDPLSPEEVRLLFDPANSGTRILLKSYLNILEFYALSVNSGLADFDIARRIWGFKILRHFSELKPYIDRSRHLANNNYIYGELEEICKQWSQVVAIKKPAYPVEP
ncbi:MAG TPA: DUF4760 domain-containing protein [Steroidobacteraceae bacterium]|nr:DUF4760 domain-containing protein [Steroidobacteraceae bacterium]